MLLDFSEDLEDTKEMATDEGKGSLSFPPKKFGIIRKGGPAKLQTDVFLLASDMKGREDREKVSSTTVRIFQLK